MLQQCYVPRAGVETHITLIVVAWKSSSPGILTLTVSKCVCTLLLVVCNSLEIPEDREYQQKRPSDLYPVYDLQGGRLWRLAEALWRWSPVHQAAASHKLEQQLVCKTGESNFPQFHLERHVFLMFYPFLQDCLFGQYSVKCILDQDVLLQEDVELIELLDPSLLTFDSSPSGSSCRASTLPRPSLIARPSLWYIVREE